MLVLRGQNSGGFWWVFLFVYLQDAREHVSKVLQQGGVAFVRQNKGRRGSSRQGTDLKDQFHDTLNMNDIKLP